MAQQVKIAGALFNDVPYIQCPDVNDVYHPFVDPSVTTAAASDVAQGKQFIAADGTLTQGTASGGGGTSIVWGRIRGDATLVKQWTYDKYIVEDEGINIPSYSTSAQTIKNGASLTSENLNFSDYSYLVIYRALATPVYSDSSKSAGREIYCAFSGVYEFPFIPISEFSHDGTTAQANAPQSQFTSISTRVFKRIVYYNSGTTIRVNDTSYGAYPNFGTHPTVTVSTSSPYNTGTLAITSPSLMIRGSSAYLNSTNWAKMTDIRFQYIFELWQIPQSATVHGWETESQFRHILDCVNGNGTLT